MAADGEQQTPSLCPSPPQFAPPLPFPPQRSSLTSATFPGRDAARTRARAAAGQREPPQVTGQAMQGVFLAPQPVPGCQPTWRRQQCVPPGRRSARAACTRDGLSPRGCRAGASRRLLPPARGSESGDGATHPRNLAGLQPKAQGGWLGKTPAFFAQGKGDASESVCPKPGFWHRRALQRPP